jgi:hypothetical protein
MKKLILFVGLLIAFAQFGVAQDAPAKKDAAKKEAKTPGPKKKDGTADMRYKANKDAAKAADTTKHLKKDGTPDKRYKENKKKG